MDVRTQVRRAAVFNNSRPAVTHGSRTISYTEAWDRGLRLANGLIALGSKPGDRVAVLDSNVLEAVDFYLGTAAANFVRVPLYARNSPEAHAHMMRHTGCKAVVVSPEYAADVHGLDQELPELDHIIVRDDSYESWLQASADSDPDPEVEPDDPYVIRHTGGTSGMPKGVLYTHRQWLATARDWFYLLPPVQAGDRCLHLGPISHGSGYFFNPVFAMGGHNILLERFDPQVALDLLEQEDIAYCFMVPTMLNTLIRHPAATGRNWSHLKALVLASAPIADDTANLAYEIFGDRLYQCYGQTEAVPASFMSATEWFANVPGSEPLRSAGRIAPYADVEILDDDGKKLPLGSEGEIAIRVDGQTTKFWGGTPEYEASRIQDGWIMTGDIGKIDANGYLYLLDRKDDMIISGGFNIWPSELENVIMDHPSITEVAVVGVPDSRWGEAPLAVCVVADSDAAVTEDEVVKLCAERLGSYKKPSKVIFQTEPLPTSAIGKVQRKKIREPYWAGQDRRISGS